MPKASSDRPRTVPHRYEGLVESILLKAFPRSASARVERVKGLLHRVVISSTIIFALGGLAIVIAMVAGLLYGT